MVNYNNPHINFSRNNQTTKAVTKVLVLAIILAFIVIILGAYTRLTNAGLGCPDWPGCYGQMIVKNNLDTKAWTEMIHRYLAGSLGLIILITSLFILFKNPSKKILSKVLVFLLLSTVIFQVLLGMWTVTYKLMPTVVMGHLLGGFCTISLLLLLLLNNLSFRNQIKFNNVTKFIAFLSLLAVCGQIILGGWTSANYAAIPCLDFPACNGQYFPT
ncbi:MAG: COX15/CtaA family protein, partial [Gammaproteobacteria bacterium]|nr:COX15/CtaA family protein [Gammaproteobacteria bacterium]